MRNLAYFSVYSWYLNINGCCKAVKVDQNTTCIGCKPQRVDAAETKISVLLSASVERFGVSRMRDFLGHTYIKGSKKFKIVWDLSGTPKLAE